MSRLILNELKMSPPPPPLHRIFKGQRHKKCLF